MSLLTVYDFDFPNVFFSQALNQSEKDCHILRKKLSKEVRILSISVQIYKYEKFLRSNGQKRVQKYFGFLTVYCIARPKLVASTSRLKDCLNISRNERQRKATGIRSKYD